MELQNYDTIKRIAYHSYFLSYPLIYFIFFQAAGLKTVQIADLLHAH
jgi:hypothetical protein